MRVTHISRPRVRPKVLIISAVLLVSAALAASARGWLSPASSAEPHPPAAGQGQGPGGRLEAELLTILPGGFDPVEITRPQGRFVLAVNNRSGAHELDLRLDRETGGREHEARIPRGRVAWQKLVDLPPGSYTLTEAGHPDWVCRIIITPN